MSIIDENEKLIEAFLSSLKLRGNSLNTQNGYKRDLDLFFKEINKSALELGFKDINLYFLGLMSGEKSPRTINRKMAAIRCFYKFLLKNEYISLDPTTKLESSKIPKRLPEYLLDSEIRKIIDATKCYRDKVIMMVLYSTGARLSELWAANINDVDFMNKKIKIIGKGNKQGFVYLTSEAIEMLKKYLDERNDENQALFVSRNGQRLGRRYIEKMVKECAEKVGIKGVHPHLYRHSLASRLAMEGIQIQTIQELLRHESITTTTLYAHLSNEKVRNDFDKVMEIKKD